MTRTSILIISYFFFLNLTHKMPNTTVAEFANTVDPDETAMDLQCLPSSL